MAGQSIAPIMPNIGNQEAAVAGSSAVIFTGTDRKIIEERSGRIDRNRSFIDLLKDRPLTPEVENEETNVKPHQDVKELEGRRREHQQMLKHSPLYTPREQVEITNELPDNYEEASTIVVEPETPTLSRERKNKTPTHKKDARVHEETVAIVKELKLDPGELFDKLALEQNELHVLISRIKDHHLKRLLAETKQGFETLSEKIKKETLASAKPEAKAWLEAQLDKLTLGAAEYKLNLIKSLQKMELNPKHEKNIKWLKKIIARLSKS